MNTSKEIGRHPVSGFLCADERSRWVQKVDLRIVVCRGEPGYI